MTVITISRQYGAGGREVAVRVCELLGYRYFDKRLMAEAISEAGLQESEIVDFTEDDYRIRSFLDHLLAFRGPRPVARVRTRDENAGGTRTRVSTWLNEAQSVELVQTAIQAVAKQGNVVIVGRGGQAILKTRPGMLHVRIEAPLEARSQRVCRRENIDLFKAQEKVEKHDLATADYLKRFFNIDWEDPML